MFLAPKTPNAKNANKIFYFVEACEEKSEGDSCEFTTPRDETNVFEMRAAEVTDDAERERLFAIGVDAFPPYADYQQKTERRIPVFLASPV